MHMVTITYIYHYPNLKIVRSSIYKSSNI